MLLWFFLFFSAYFLVEMTGMDTRVGDLLLLVSVGLLMMVSKLLKRSLLNLVGSELVRNCEKLLILSQL